MGSAVNMRDVGIYSLKEKGAYQPVESEHLRGFPKHSAEKEDHVGLKFRGEPT